MSLAAAVVSGCAANPDGTLYRTTVNGPDGSSPQEVVLGDATGLVTGIEPAPVDDPNAFDPPTVSADPDDPNALVLRWSNGACDHAAIAFKRSGARFVISIDPRTPMFGSCTANLLFRSIRIRLSEPIGPNSIDLPSAR